MLAYLAAATFTSTDELFILLSLIGIVVLLCLALFGYFYRRP